MLPAWPLAQQALINLTSIRCFLGEEPLAELSPTHMKRVEDALRILTGDIDRGIGLEPPYPLRKQLSLP